MTVKFSKLFFMIVRSVTAACASTAITMTRTNHLAAVSTHRVIHGNDSAFRYGFFLGEFDVQSAQKARLSVGRGNTLPGRASLPAGTKCVTGSTGPNHEND